MGCNVRLWEPVVDEAEETRGSGTDAHAGNGDGHGAGAGLRFDVADLVALLEEGGGEGGGASSSSGGAATPRVKAVITNFPHNPTGFLPSAAEWGRLLDACRQHGCYLFSDEVREGGRVPRGRVCVHMHVQSWYCAATHWLHALLLAVPICSPPAQAPQHY
jgi:hypothetical protein